MKDFLSSSSFFSGISGLKLNIPKYKFPQDFQNSTRLTYYASLFNSIEINSSFYKMPQEKTAAKWSVEVPENFRFTFKLYKEITHSKELNFNKEFVNQFFCSINAVGNKKGCVLIQFPPGIGIEYITKLQKVLNFISRLKTNWKIAVEFRNKSWYNNSTYYLLNSYNAALVIQDISKSATPMIDHQSEFLYIRFHGPAGNYRDSYSEPFLSEYSTYINEWLEEGKTVFVYFNNTIGDAFQNLLTLNKLLIDKMQEAL